MFSNCPGCLLGTLGSFKAKAFQTWYSLEWLSEGLSCWEVCVSTLSFAQRKTGMENLWGTEGLVQQHWIVWSICSKWAQHLKHIQVTCSNASFSLTAVFPPSDVWFQDLVHKQMIRIWYRCPPSAERSSRMVSLDSKLTQYVCPLPALIPPGALGKLNASYYWLGYVNI